jgi:signal peptidase I
MALNRYIPDKETPKKRTWRYVLGAVMCLATIAFSAWAGWAWLIVLPFVVDYYFTKFINWSWGRNHRNPIIKGLVSVVGDVLYVIVTITFIFTFFFQNFGIPSSSLEKTLLTGDYLFVSKLKYGPRLPMTPLSLPLVHNRLGDMETYSTAWTLPYKRLAGYGKIERNDLVVFNFPAGDTVATRMTNPDYLTLCYMYGRDVVNHDKAVYGDIVYRPVDKRDHYVKRLIGMPGDTLQIKDAQVYINGKAQKNPTHMQLNYLVQTNGLELTKELLDELEINYRDVSEQPALQAVSPEQIEQFKAQSGLSPIDDSGSYGRIYEMPLTEEMRMRLKGEAGIVTIVRTHYTPDASTLYPLGLHPDWTVDNYGPIYIPKAGVTIQLNPLTYATYERCIRAYEGHKLEERLGQYFIDGKPATSYTFAQNYYWMMGDNRHNSADSRAWGFVPEDHIVGTPSFLWLSLNDEQPLFSGGIRWSRMMRFITGK